MDAHVIRPPRGWARVDLRELWGARELVYFLTARDISVRYKQTALGVSWAIIQPVFTMVVFTVFFGRLAKVPSDGLPYPLFAFCGLVPWTFFSNALSTASNSLVASQNLLRKVYFPRLAIPVSAVLSGLPDLAAAFVVLVGLALWYGVRPEPGALLWLPAFVLLALVTSLGVGLWSSALNVEYRDVRYAVPFLVQAWLIATPVAYPASLLEEPARTIYGLNPMVGVVEGFRWALLGTAVPPTPAVYVSALVSVVLLVGGAIYFTRMERNFADVV